MSLRLIALFALLGASGALHAQYPAKPITLVVPFTAASDADLAARNLADHAAKYLGNQPIVVVNQPGASGAIGTLAVRNAPADGYTLLLARIASQVILPATDVKTPYHWSDFTLLSLLEVNPYVCAVKADAPWKSMKELTDEIAKHPGKLNFASVGAGTLQNFGPQYLFSLLGLPKDAAAGIAYKGSGELTTALLGGQVQFACSNLGALLPHLKSGTLRALVGTSGAPAGAARSADRARTRLARDGEARGVVGAGGANPAAEGSGAALDRCARKALPRSGLA